jgi:Raf kinase inhibitor-like YbhB/YbcL family protein
VLPPALGVLMLALVAACDTGDGRELQPPTEPAPLVTEPTAAPTVATLPVEPIATLAPPEGFSLVTPWRDGAPISTRHTCDGVDVSPSLSWSGVPDGTIELAISMTDDDADGFVHWLLVGIDPSVRSVFEAEVPDGARTLLNSFGNPVWNGPCPPAGAPHAYRFVVHALNQQVEVADDIAPADALALIEELTLEGAVVYGTYGR